MASFVCILKSKRWVFKTDKHFKKLHWANMYTKFKGSYVITSEQMSSINIWNKFCNKFESIAFF